MSNNAPTPTFDKSALSAIPQLLRDTPAWLVWRYIQGPDDKKPRKVPFYANGKVREGEQGSHEPLATFDAAVQAAERGRYAGVGLAMLRSNGIVALDFDDCVSDGVLDARVAALVEGTYAEFSPSGNGVRAFFRGDLSDGKDNKHEPKVEVFCGSGFVTVTGNALPDCDMWGWSEAAELPETVIAMHRTRIGDRSAASDDDFMIALKPKVGWTLDDAKAVLKRCDPNAPREQWFQILAALHHEFDGSDDALDLADEWSSGRLGEVEVENYSGRRDVEGRWNSLGKRNNREPIGAAYILRIAKDTTAHEKYDATAEWRKAIGESHDEFSLRERVCVQISRDERLGDMERELLAAALQDKFKSLGTKYPIAQCRKLVEKRAPKKPGGSDIPEWAKGWVYVTDDDKFFRIDSEEWLTMQGFNAKFNREMPVNEEGEVSRAAAWYALEDLGIPSVTKAMYLPWGGPLFETEGIKCVNTYRPSSVPAASGTIGQGGREAVKVVMRHIDLLCGGRTKERDALVAWMAHNVQHPGVKIRWAPLIKGVEGDGKSLLGGLMAAMMGRTNVRNISPKVLGTDFTGWAEGAAIGVLEEIKLTGHNRYDILNALKPFVTNDSVEIHRKGCDPYDAVNTMNYIAFTNHGDALPLNDTDRRWFVLFTPFASRDDLSRAVGGSGLRAYFDVLHSSIESHRAELRQWMLDYAIPEWFNRNGDAPETREKASMVAMSISSDEDAARDVIERGAVGVTRNLLSSKCLADAMTECDDPFSIATTSINRLLTKMGFSQLPKKVKWNGAAHRVWTRGEVPSGNEGVRAVLDSTMTLGSEFDDGFFN